MPTITALRAIPALFLLAFTHLLAPAPAQAAPTAPTATINLASSYEWHYRLDPTDLGTTAGWWRSALPAKQRLRLPGSLTENRLGDPITSATPWVIRSGNFDKWLASPDSAPCLKPGNVRIPFWLTPLRYYSGPAWYQREITIPKDWRNAPAQLYLERAHWRTDTWIDDQPLGHRDSLSAPHVYDLGQLTPGKHRLTIRVDNRLQVNVGLNAHSVSDHTQTNWNGLIGKLELRRQPNIRIADLQVYPSARQASARVVATIQADEPTSASGKLQGVLYAHGSADAQSSYVSIPYELSGTTVTTAQLELPLTRPMRLWDEFNPSLYQARLSGQFFDGDTTRGLASVQADFGFRDFTTSGTQFILNGHPIMLRGTLECCIFPLTGYPPTDVGAWRHILQVCRSYGLNHLRFHSWCPPEAAFQAADEEGFYLSIECASWTNVGEDPAYDAWLDGESERILREYGNHPSFCMMLYGNEPQGSKNRTALANLVTRWKKEDPRRLYSGGAGWPIIPENQFHITPKARIHIPRAKTDTRINAEPPETITDYRDFVSAQSAPVITHEIGQWCVYPNLEERSRYTGITRAYNFDIVAESLARHHMLDQAHDFLMASGKLQALCYKEEIESALRTPGLGGFQLLDLHDFPGQGTALVGVLDPFWNSKGYITADEYRQFSGPVVPLARLAKRVFTSDETLTASVDITNYGPTALPRAHARWALTTADGATVGEGDLGRKTLPQGKLSSLGNISFKLAGVKAPQKLTLSVSLDGTDARNTWDLWVYPPKVSTAAPPDVTIAKRLDAATLQKLEAGEKVLLLPDPADVVTPTSGPVKTGFSSIFWNTAWFPGSAPETLGILCDPQHPAFASFPTEYHTNWQWWYLIHGSPTLLLDPLKPSVRPLVQLIDDWNTNRRLGYMLEAKVGNGKLLISTLPLDKRQDPVTRQLLHSLQNYMHSEAFTPQQKLTKQDLQTILK